MLVVLLRVWGTMGLLALFAALMPLSWMGTVHEWMGLGEFPASPIVEYLTRSVSVLYACFGGLLLIVSRDVRRNRVTVTYMAAMAIVFGIAVLGIDIYAGLPLSWVLGEGPPTILLGVILLRLLRAVQRS